VSQRDQKNSKRTEVELVYYTWKSFRINSPNADSILLEIVSLGCLTQCMCEADQNSIKRDLELWGLFTTIEVFLAVHMRGSWHKLRV
jgi:hypothetical protein